MTIGRIRTNPDAKITKMKDGRTHLGHKAEHAIDLDTGAIVGVTVQGADEGDTTTIQATLPEAAEQLEVIAAVTEDAVAVRTYLNDCSFTPARSIWASGCGRSSVSARRAASRAALWRSPR